MKFLKQNWFPLVLLTGLLGWLATCALALYWAYAG